MHNPFTITRISRTDFDPEHTFTTSWLLPPLFLACYRALFALFGWTNIFVSFGWDSRNGAGAGAGQTFSYFTVLTWWGITTYMTIASIHTFVYSFKGYSWLERWPRPLQMLHSFFYTTIISYPFLVTIVYWPLLYSGHWFTQEYNAYSNISRHGLNSLAALLEIFLPATCPPPPWHVPFYILLLALYLALAYLTHYTQGWYPYTFLDPSHGRSRLTAYILGVFAAALIVLALATLLVFLRRKFTGPGKRSRRDRGIEYRPAQEMYHQHSIEMARK